MKLVVTLSMLTLCCQMTLAQLDRADRVGSQVALQTERTTELEQLYLQGKQLENSGTAAEIEANRLAIKNAWQNVNPQVAALYKPVDNSGLLPETEANMAINGVGQFSQLRERDERPPSTRDWDVDRLLLDDWVDGGVDIEVTGAGDIYISAFQNDIENGGEMFDEIIIYRSLDGGVTFEEWQRANVTAPMRKMQLISIDGSGDEFLVAYLVTSTGNFQVWRWNTSTGVFDAQGISADVTDFSVDRNYPVNTNTQRVFATYVKSGTTHSGRSTSGSYGFDWVDELDFGTTTSQLDFAYGLNGAIYTTYIGGVTGNLYARTNTDYNDPASWELRETIVTGAATESLNPSIRAARKSLASDEVLILTSSRAAGSTQGYEGASYIRESEGAYVAGTYISTTVADYSIAHIDTWIGKDTNDEVIQTAYVRDDLDNSDDDVNRSRTYDGTAFQTFEGVGDSGVDIWDGFASAIAETNDALPCMAFAGTSGGGGFGFGLFFDAKTEIILNTQDNIIEGLAYYPNPTQNVLNVRANNTIEKLSVFAVTGAKVLEMNSSTNEVALDMSALQSGVYLLNVVSNTKVGTYKIVKQ